MSAEITVTGRESSAGLTLLTRGLAAQGRPELTVTGLPPYLGQAWARLLAVLAYRLARHPGETPGHLTLTPDDLTAALGEPTTGWHELTIALVRHGDNLAPAPPPDYQGTPATWHTDIAKLLFPSATT